MYKLLTLSFVLVLIDQVTKLAVKGFNLFGLRHEGMRIGESFELIGDAVRCTFVENKGMAFGIDLGVPILLGLFSIGAAIFLVYLLWKARHEKTTMFHVSLAIILAGAVGNLIDRVFYGVFYGYGPLFGGRVVDFIDVDLPDFMMDRFYIFNIADSAVTVGLSILIVLQLIQLARESKEKKLAEMSGSTGSSEHMPEQRTEGYTANGGGAASTAESGAADRTTTTEAATGESRRNDSGSQAAATDQSKEPRRPDHNDTSTAA